MALINNADAIYLGDRPVGRVYLGNRRVWPTWLPSDLFANGEQGAWYDPSDMSTMFQDAAGTVPVTGVGQPVGLMLDRSGNGNHASQTTTTARPTLQQDENGKLHLVFDGVDDYLLAEFPESAARFTLAGVAVHDQTASSQTAFLYQKGSSSSESHSSIARVSTLLRYTAMRDDADYNAPQSPTGVVSGNRYVASARFDRASENESASRLNGAPNTGARSAVSGGSASGVLSICANAGGVARFPGSVYGFIFVERDTAPFASADLDNVDHYLSSKLVEV